MLSSDAELMAQIEAAVRDYKGDITKLHEAVGMLVVGRLMGWRVVRLVSNVGTWKLACNLFGDLKGLMPERGKYAHKSRGLAFTDAFGGYWESITGVNKSLRVKERRASE